MGNYKKPIGLKNLRQRDFTEIPVGGSGNPAGSQKILFARTKTENFDRCAHHFKSSPFME
jgi:hypothetical protein